MTQPTVKDFTEAGYRHLYEWAGPGADPLPVNVVQNTAKYCGLAVESLKAVRIADKWHVFASLEREPQEPEP